MSKPDDFDPEKQVERERLLRWARRDASAIPLTELERAERDYYNNSDWTGAWAAAAPTLVTALFSPWWLIGMPFVSGAIFVVGAILSRVVQMLFDRDGDAPLWSIAWGLTLAAAPIGFVAQFYADVAWSEARFLAGGIVGYVLCIPCGVLFAHARMNTPRPRYLELLDEARREPPGIIE